MATVSLGGVRLAFDDTGMGSGPPVLFVHGTPFNRSMWYPQLAALKSAGRRAIAPDLRGYGSSSVVPGTTKFATFASDLLALLESRGVTESVVVCGLSMGGQIAMEFCRIYPQSVAGLALVATKPQAEDEAGKRVRYATAERIEREGMEPYAKEVLPKMLAAKTFERQPDIAEQVLRMMLGTHPAGAAAALRGRAERPPYETVLAELDVPALVVVGDSDAFTSRSDAEKMHSLLRKSELVWMRGVGHMPNLENESDFNSAMERLLQRTTRPDG